MADLLDQLNRRLDHALLKPETTEAEVIEATRLCRELNLFSLCVNPTWVAIAAEEFRNSRCTVISVAGFSLGANRTDIKVDEALRAVRDGATEIDMVANIGWIRSSEMTKVGKEIKAVRDAIPYSIGLKVIIECNLLTASQQDAAVAAVIDGGAQFVKTGTGFAGGATIKQVERLVKVAGGQIEVKAAGGIRTLADCRAMLGAGATRLGCSSSAEIIHQWRLHHRKYR